MTIQILQKLSDRIFDLRNLVYFLSGIVIGCCGCLWHNLEPDAHNSQRERQREVDQEDGGAELKQTEVLQIHKERIPHFLVSLVGLDFLLFWLIVFFLQVQLKHIVDLGLLTDHDVLFALHKSILRVLGQDFACASFELTDNNFLRHDLVYQVPHRHLYDLDASENVGPAHTVHDELIQFLCPTLEKALVIFAEVMGLLLALSIPLSAAFPSFDVVPVVILHVFV